MANEIQIPVGHAELDNYMRKIVLKRFPGAKIYEKRSSVLMWTLYLVSFMWIWQPRFFKGFTTVIGYKVYISQRAYDRKDWGSVYRTMRHEFIHMLQKEAHGFLFTTGYIFPQVLAALALPALLAIWFSNWWLLCLLFLVALGPWPAPFRAKWEKEGYTQSLLVTYEDRGETYQPQVEKIISFFTGAAYYFMYPFKSKITKDFDGIVDDIETGKISGYFYPYSA